MAEVRLTRGEYWLLETAVIFSIPIRCLLAPNIEEKFNKPGHGLARGPLVATIERLVAQGFVVAETETRSAFVPARSEIEAALDESGPPQGEWTSYLLTAVGGAAWESFAAPDWDRYIDDSFDFPDDAEDVEAHEVICADRTRLDSYLRQLWSEGELDAASLVHDVLVPWQATYWKVLPRGHRARFRFRDDPAARPPEASWRFTDGWYNWR
jgi:hypothetical protein